MPLQCARWIPGGASSLPSPKGQCSCANMRPARVCAGGVWGAGRRRRDVRCDSHSLVACESSEEGYTVWTFGQAGEAVGGRVGRLSCRSVGGCTRQQEGGAMVRFCAAAWASVSTLGVGSMGQVSNPWRNMSENPQTHRHKKNGACVRGSVRPDGDRVLSYLRKLRGFTFASPSSS